MAAIYTEKISPLLDQACKIVHFERLDENEHLKNLLKTVPFKPSHVVLVVGTLVSVLTLLNVGASLICNLVGFIYPAYMSFKALESAGTDDDKQWLTYWIVYSVCSVADTFLGFVFSFIPFYYFIKLAFFVYLFHPKTVGATVIFEKVVSPLLTKYESKIDGNLDKLKNQFSQAKQN